MGTYIKSLVRHIFPARHAFSRHAARGVHRKMSEKEKEREREREREREIGVASKVTEAHPTTVQEVFSTSCLLKHPSATRNNFIIAFHIFAYGRKRPICMWLCFYSNI
jgi:hypothetical protein